MITLVILLIPLVFGIILIQSDGKVGPIPVKLIGIILTIVFGLFTLLYML